VVQWVSVEDKLPEHRQTVLVYAGNYIQSSKFHVATFYQGISEKEREAMKNGEIKEKFEYCAHYEGDDPIHSYVPRHRVYKSEDEHGNNQRPYNWVVSPLEFFGQDVTFWSPLEVPHE